MREGKVITLQLQIDEARVLRGSLECFVLSMKLSPGIWYPGMEEAAETALGKLNEAIAVASGGRSREDGEDGRTD